jgi:hypothetical protein
MLCLASLCLPRCPCLAAALADRPLRHAQIRPTSNTGRKNPDGRRV